MTRTRPSDRHSLSALDCIIQAMYLRDPGMDALRCIYYQDAICLLQKALEEVQEIQPKTMEMWDSEPDGK